MKDTLGSADFDTVLLLYSGCPLYCHGPVGTTELYREVKCIVSFVQSVF